MTQDTIEADGAEEIAELFVDVREGDRLTLTVEMREGDEQTAHADTEMTERAEDDLMAFWYRDLDLGRAEGDTDGVPFATVCYRSVCSGSPPTVRVHGHTPTPEATAGIEYLDDVVRAVVDERSGEEAQNAQ